MPRQSISRQIEGIMLIEAATSSRKIEGTISRAGMMMEIAVIESSEKPKPEKPRTMAARKITMLERRSSCQCCRKVDHRPAASDSNALGPPTQRQARFNAGGGAQIRV